VEYLTDVLLGALAPELILHQFDRGRTLDGCKHAWEGLVRGLVGEAPRLRELVG
jgi:hypothetical protein